MAQPPITPLDRRMMEVVAKFLRHDADELQKKRDDEEAAVREEKKRKEVIAAVDGFQRTLPLVVHGVNQNIGKAYRSLDRPQGAENRLVDGHGYTLRLTHDRQETGRSLTISADVDGELFWTDGDTAAQTNSFGYAGTVQPDDIRIMLISWLENNIA